MQLIRCALVLVGVCAVVQVSPPGKLSVQSPLSQYSAPNDSEINGEDLSGGYHDDADEADTQADELARLKDSDKFPLDYALGGKGHSYVVGHGNNLPSHELQRPTSSAGDSPPCNWNIHKSPQVNYHVLYKILVGCHDANDNNGVHSENERKSHAATTQASTTTGLPSRSKLINPLIENIGHAP